VLAMPLTVCVVIVGRYVPQMRFISVLLRDRSELSVDERIYQRLLAHDDFEAGRIAEEHVDREQLESSLDQTMIDTLCLVEQGRHAGIVDDERGDYVCRAVRDLASDIMNAQGHDESSIAISGPTVVCVPVGDAADEAANDIFTQLLAKRGVAVESMGIGTLASEVADAVERLDAQVVVLSVLPPVSLSAGRYLCRSLRTRFPKLTLCVAIWRGDEKSPLAARFEGDGATTILTSLATAVNRVRQYVVSSERPEAKTVDQARPQAQAASR
jgi:methylmalonyl-CoA mutase cobalamin-binding subunit